MKNYPARNLIYVAAGGIGLGHFLVSTSVFKHYADRTNRKFHVICNKWIMGLDEQADIDPIYSMLFGEKATVDHGFNASLKYATDTIESRHQNGEAFLVVGNRAQGLTRLKKNLDKTDFLDKAAYMMIDQFRKFLVNGEDHPIDNIVVDVEPPAQSWGWPFDFYRDVPVLAPLSCALRDPGIDLNQSVGLHIRHGNGEDLNRRTSGSSPGFDLLVDRIVSSAKKIGEEHSMRMVAFSDSSALLEHLGQKHGIASLSHGDSLDVAWQQKLGASKGPEHKRKLISHAMRDIHCLSQCAHVVCGASLFAIAAYIHSPYKNFLKVMI